MIKRNRPLKRSAIKRKPPKKRRSKSELTQFKKKLWTKFAKWIKDTKGNDCFSCDRRGLVGKQLHAGHLLSAGQYSAIRWDPDAVWPQCAYCNMIRKGNYLEYRDRFIQRFGQDRFDKLWNRRHDVAQWRIDDLKHVEKMIDDDYERRRHGGNQV